MSRRKLLLGNELTEEQQKQQQRQGWHVGLLVFCILIAGGLVLGCILLAQRIDRSNHSIQTLKMQNMHLESDLASVLMMQNLQYETRFVQNGTVGFGFAQVASGTVSQYSNFLNHVVLQYQLKEVFLTPAGVPLTVLTISATPEPLTFPGWNPPPTQPSENDMVVNLALFDPPINSIDAAAQNFLVAPYSSVTASKIHLSPDCVMSAACVGESAFSPRFTSSAPTFNSVYIYPNGLEAPGSGVMRFTWGHQTYASLGAQYDFVGTNITITAPIEFLLPVL